MSVPHKAGFVAIVGAPNAGKSTLLNRILGEKVAIVTSKPQTTRHRILGVHTQSRPPAQLVFWDTPGLHRPGRAPLNQEMMNQALTALTDSDLALWVVDSLRRGPEHEIALEILLQNRRPLIVALNKTDAATDKSRLLPLIREIQTQAEPEAVVPISARTGDGLPALLTEIIRLLPENPPLYPEDTLTDQAERDIAAELIREAVFKLTNQEIPYSTTVTIDEFKAEPSIVHISATIHVEKDSQKGVIIGARGSKLKKIGQTARISIEHLLNSKVYLSLFISARA